ncbi:hypothetical protein [Magnetospirillum sp. 15-1]|uniref:hypothetical protein n=1 Tax=Magnetospirillum sp. 15-1 TaxID=1979370 RepID=UPI001F5B1973|nr:hypothetical protein [Magnetospirillum sp. 15-1]
MDTNVVLVANGQHHDVSLDCVAACALALQALMRQGRLVLDDQFRILTEYQNKTQPKTGNRPGDAFVKWALNNRMKAQFVDLVVIREHEDRGFDSFPDNRALATFDAPDRVFVAVAGAHAEQPPILQAADSKWLDWAPALTQHGIVVEFLCPDDIQKFHKNKFGV